MAGCLISIKTEILLTLRLRSRNEGEVSNNTQVIVHIILPNAVICGN